MKKKLKENKEQLLVYLFCLIIALFTLLFASKNSPLFPFNDWVDVNAFFTVGKSMMHGVIPYLDLFEQKGILLYLIYGIGSLISFKSFIGVFIIEVLFWSLFLYFIYKIFNLFLSISYGLIGVPLISMLIATCFSFTHGGSAEEFSFLFMIIPIYYMLKYFKTNKLTYKESILCGVMASCVFLIKYTLMGYFFGIFLFIFIDFLIHKKVREGFLHGLSFAVGFLIPIIITLIYLGINGGIESFIRVYFYLNMTAYPGVVATLGERINSICRGVLNIIKLNGGIISTLLLLYPILICFIKISKKNKLYLLLTYIFTIIVIYYGLRFHLYYALPVIFFIILSMLGLFSLIDRYIVIKNKRKVSIIFICISVISSACLSYCWSNNKDFMGVKKEDLFQYEYSEIINKYDNPTLLNIDSLDCGLYFTTGIIPNTYFFEQQNFNYEVFPDNIDSFNEYIEEKKTMFIILHTLNSMEDIALKYPMLDDNYELIRSRNQEFEGYNFLANLYIVKEGV